MNKIVPNELTQDKIVAEVEKINRKIKKWQQLLTEVRAVCSHPNVIKTHGANTGNWCPQDDCYWTDFKCPDCGKIWRLEGSL